MARRKALPELSDAEWKVIRALWKRHPASARDVLEALHGETGWAYTTVKTLLARLVAKGAATVRLRANTSLYEPQITEAEARRTEVRLLIDRAFGGASVPLLRFVLTEEKLSAKDRAELRAMLERAGKNP
ncbi:MAG TPA: BlaI/MecI/CopY family transcriptional regulator [Planctomycetota bacterium]|jgi:BlaI family penicillinase repressor|nr:BlaI/MecI/CopY family transcriptional regulator [Planctomycetota bacterium]